MADNVRAFTRDEALEALGLRSPPAPAEDPMRKYRDQVMERAMADALLPALVGDMAGADAALTSGPSARELKADGDARAELEKEKRELEESRKRTAERDAEIDKQRKELAATERRIRQLESEERTKAFKDRLAEIEREMQAIRVRRVERGKRPLDDRELRSRAAAVVHARRQSEGGK